MATSLIKNHTRTNEVTEVTCACKICKVNAKYLGIAGPLRATVCTDTARTLIADRGAHGRHFLVYIAHSSDVMNAELADRFGASPVPR